MLNVIVSHVSAEIFDSVREILTRFKASADILDCKQMAQSMGGKLLGIWFIKRCFHHNCIKQIVDITTGEIFLFQIRLIRVNSVLAEMEVLLMYSAGNWRYSSVPQFSML